MNSDLNIPGFIILFYLSSLSPLIHQPYIYFIFCSLPAHSSTLHLIIPVHFTRSFINTISIRSTSLSHLIHHSYMYFSFRFSLPAHSSTLQLCRLSFPFPYSFVIPTRIYSSPLFLLIYQPYI